MILIIILTIGGLSALLVEWLEIRDDLRRRRAKPALRPAPPAVRLASIGPEPRIAP